MIGYTVFSLSDLIQRIGEQDAQNILLVFLFMKGIKWIRRYI